MLNQVVSTSLTRPEPPFGGAPYECGIDPVTLDPLIDIELDFPVLEYGPITLWPGVYCGRFTLKNSTHAFLMPGLYIMQGGPMNIEGDSILEGYDVTFFLTESPTYPFSPMSIQSSTAPTLTATTNPADPYYGILFYQDPAAGEGMSLALLKLSGDSVHDYATISDDSPSPSCASRARSAATS